MSIQRVALVFDNQVRPDTTGGYCLRALQNLVSVEHFLPTDLPRVPRSGFDLYLNIDDGLPYDFPTDLRPSAWWAIDTHLNGDWCEGSEVPILQALRDEGLLSRVGHIVGEWHAPDERETSRASVKTQLRAILSSTHAVTFSPDRPGREGYFTACRTDSRSCTTAH